MIPATQLSPTSTSFESNWNGVSPCGLEHRGILAKLSQIPPKTWPNVGQVPRSRCPIPTHFRSIFRPNSLEFGPALVHACPLSIQSGRRIPNKVGPLPPEFGRNRARIGRNYPNSADIEYATNSGFGRTLATLVFEWFDVVSISRKPAPSSTNSCRLRQLRRCSRGDRF